MMLPNISRSICQKIKNNSSLLFVDCSGVLLLEATYSQGNISFVKAVTGLNLLEQTEIRDS